MTEVYKVNPLRPSKAVLRRAAEVIKKGGLVAFPTETVYGLGADALNPEAVGKIFSSKERPPDNPLIVHVADKSKVYDLAGKVPEEATVLMKAFFPGPLTIILEKKPTVPDVTTGYLPTVAIRMPDHIVALALIEKAGTPIAAPSANKAGRPSPTKAEHVLEDLYGEVDLVIDGGPTKFGLESTVIDLTVDPPQILRPGAMTVETLRGVLREVCFHPAVLKRVGDEGLFAKSPGMKYRHYAPKADLIVIVGKDRDVQSRINDLIRDLNAKRLKAGVAVTTGKKYKAHHTEDLGESKEDIAKSLFSALRRFDKAGVNVILAEGIDEEGLGLAIMNRLKKASGYRVLMA